MRLSNQSLRVHETTNMSKRHMRGLDAELAAILALPQTPREPERIRIAKTVATGLVSLLESPGKLDDEEQKVLCHAGLIVGAILAGER